MEAGDKKPLNVTQQARHRVMVGLGWDPAEEPSLWEQIKSLFVKKNHHHDLDLSCFIYDAQKNFIESVSADTRKAIDASGKIYHSGDNEEGIGEGDDEEISVELKEIDDIIHHIIFKAHIKTGHTFSDIEDTHIRLADGYTNHNFLQQDMQCDAGQKADAYVFCRLYRNDDQWQIHFIGEYVKTDDTKSWDETLVSYID